MAITIPVGQFNFSFKFSNVVGYNYFNCKGDEKLVFVSSTNSPFE